jgi:hypothetical protein
VAAGGIAVVSKRVVVLVLGAALASGVVLGVASARLGVGTLLRSLGLPFAQPYASGPTDVVEPPLETLPFTFTGKLMDGSGRGTVDVNVPNSWRELVKAELWRDFHDPSEELNLRIRADLPEKSPEAAAAAHQTRNSGLPNYQVLGSQWIELASDLPMVYELRYSYTDKGRTRYVIESFFGDRKVFLVGGYYWEGQEDRIREPIEEAIRTFDYTNER